MGRRLLQEGFALEGAIWLGQLLVCVDCFSRARRSASHGGEEDAQRLAARVILLLAAGLFLVECGSLLRGMIHDVFKAFKINK